MNVIIDLCHTDDGGVSIIVPHYKQPQMLLKHLLEWREYPGWAHFKVVDDGSPEPYTAEAMIRAECPSDTRYRLELYRINQDISWNRGGARNLGAHVSQTSWIIQLDIDHVLPWEAFRKLLHVSLDPAHWYRFPRWRVGRADETRKKDAIPPDCEFGKIHPHVDSYLITRELYWRVGGYNEDFSGSLGGGNAFLRELEAEAGPPLMLPDDICLHVYTRHAIPDASDNMLSRDTSRSKRLEKQLRRVGRIRSSNHLRFPWEKVEI